MNLSKNIAELPQSVLMDIASHGLDKLKDGVGIDNYASDLHHYLYNEDYFIIGTYQAKQFLKDCTLDAIEIIREYEQDNFGEVNTDFSSPEEVVGMLAYIVGGEILSNCTMPDDMVEKENADIIIRELEEYMNLTQE